MKNFSRAAPSALQGLAVLLCGAAFALPSGAAPVAPQAGKTTAMATQDTQGVPALIPLPRQVAWQKGGITLKDCTLEGSAAETFLRAEAERVLSTAGVALDPKATVKIRFRTGAVADAPQGNGEAYALIVSNSGVEVVAPHNPGAGCMACKPCGK